MRNFEDWLKLEMAKGYASGEDTIKDIMWMSIGQGLKGEAIAARLNTNGGNLTGRSVNRILARYGLTKNTLDAIRQEAIAQQNVSSHGRALPAGEARPAAQTPRPDPQIDPGSLTQQIYAGPEYQGPYYQQSVTPSYTPPPPKRVQPSQAKPIDPNMRKTINSTAAAFQQKFGVPPNSDLGKRIAQFYGYERRTGPTTGNVITKVRQKALDDPTDPQEVIRMINGPKVLPMGNTPPVRRRNTM